MCIRDRHKPAGPLRGGKYSMFDGGSRVPMIAWAPGRIKPGESPALFSHADFLTSFAQIAGVNIPTSERADSLDMSEGLFGKDNEGRENLVTEGIGAKTVIRQNNWVYLPPTEGPTLFAGKDIETGCSPEPQLYDLDADIGQRENLAEKEPERVASLEALLDLIKRS